MKVLLSTIVLMDFTLYIECHKFGLIILKNSFFRVYYGMVYYRIMYQNIVYYFLILFEHGGV